MEIAVAELIVGVMKIVTDVRHVAIRNIAVIVKIVLIMAVAVTTIMGDIIAIIKTGVKSLARDADGIAD